MFLEVEMMRKCCGQGQYMVHSDAIRKYYFLKLEHLRKFWNYGPCLVHSGAIWNSGLKVGTALVPPSYRVNDLHVFYTILKSDHSIVLIYNLLFHHYLIAFKKTHT